MTQKAIREATEALVELRRRRWQHLASFGYERREAERFVEDVAAVVDVLLRHRVEELAL